jgi:hypothetical protein
MRDYLASAFIDDELDLDEKVVFIRNIRKSDDAYRGAIDLLTQERLLRCALRAPSSVPAVRRGWRDVLKIWWAAHVKPLAAAAVGLAVGLLIFIFYPSPALPPQTSRFVIFLPQARQVELSGTFTEWQRLPMQPVGRSGYWELNIPLNSGEHRYVFILDDDHRMADPTQPHREWDDFGGENSIIRIGDRT